MALPQLRSCPAFSGAAAVLVAVTTVVAARATLAAAAAADTYAIKISRPSKVGERYGLTATVSDQRAGTFTVAGKEPRRQSADVKLALAGEVTVLEVSPRGRETKVSCAVTRCELTPPDGKVVPLVRPGQVLSAAWQGKEEVVTVEGGEPLPRDAVDLLRAVLPVSDPDLPDDDATFGTRDRKRVGDAWDADREQLLAGAQRQQMPVAKGGVGGRVTLAEVRKVNGVDCVVLRAKITATLGKGGRMPGMPPTLSVTGGTVTSDLDLVQPADTTAHSISQSHVMESRITAAGDAPDGSGPATVEVTFVRKSEERIEMHK